jgi:hypothetical protein
MPKRQLTKAQSSKRLLKKLIDNPALPAYVRTLKAPVLKRLIDHVGLHDAGELIALTTTEQMRDVLESLWESLTPGRADRLGERFLEWPDEAGCVRHAAPHRPGRHVRGANFAPLIR